MTAVKVQRNSCQETAADCWAAVKKRRRMWRRLRRSLSHPVTALPNHHRRLSFHHNPTWQHNTGTNKLAEAPGARLPARFPSHCCCWPRHSSTLLCDLCTSRLVCYFFFIPLSPFLFFPLCVMWHAVTDAASCLMTSPPTRCWLRPLRPLGILIIRMDDSRENFVDTFGQCLCGK